MARDIRRIINALMRWKERIYQEYQTDLVEPFAKRDEKGEIVRDPSGAELFDIQDPKKEEEYNKALEAFNSRKATVKRDRLSLMSLDDLKLCSAEMDALSSLLEEDPEITKDNAELSRADNVIPMKPKE